MGIEVGIEVGFFGYRSGTSLPNLLKFFVAVPVKAGGRTHRLTPSLCGVGEGPLVPCTPDLERHFLRRKRKARLAKDGANAAVGGAGGG